MSDSYRHVLITVLGEHNLMLKYLVILFVITCGIFYVLTAVVKFGVLG